MFSSFLIKTRANLRFLVLHTYLTFASDPLWTTKRGSFPTIVRPLALGEGSSPHLSVDQRRPRGPSEKTTVVIQFW